MIALRKTENGGLEARHDDFPWLLINRSPRIVNGERMVLKQFLNVAQGRMIIGFNRICMSMLCEEGLDEGLFGFQMDNEEDKDSYLVVWNGPVFLYVPTISNSKSINLVNEKGQYLAGSNLWPNGELCLNVGWTPFNMEAADALLYNHANMDLAWQGPYHKGKWVDGDGGLENMFLIEQWGTFGRAVAIPDAIVEEVVRG